MRSIRKKSGVSLREVARRMEFSAAYVSDLERGRQNWSEEKAARFLKALE